MISSSQLLANFALWADFLPHGLFHFRWHTLLIIRLVDYFRFPLFSLLNVNLFLGPLFHCICDYFAWHFFLPLSLLFCVNYQFKCKLWTDEDGCDTGEQKDGHYACQSYFPSVPLCWSNELAKRFFQGPCPSCPERSWSVILGSVFELIMSLWVR